MTKICSVDYCSDPHRTKGFCGRHYTSFWRHGSAIHVDVSVEFTTGVPNHFVCSKCTKVKHADSFFLRVRDGIERRDKACRKCISDQSIEYRNNRMPDHVRETVVKNRKLYRAKKTYGEAGLAIQVRIDSGEPCEICGGYTSKMAIDHCHDSGKVRGLLCSNCNTALGLLQEDPERIASMLRYLDAHKEVLK